MHPPERALAPPPEGVGNWFGDGAPLPEWSALVDRIVWARRPTRTLDGGFGDARWFADGTLNVTESCLDRHARSHPDAIAYEYECENGERRSIAYGALLAEVNRLATAFDADGVRVGDRVGIYMPQSIESIVAMLACARIGAIHMVVFAGMGVSALASRLRDVGASVLLAGDLTYRRGRTVDLLSIAEQAAREVGLRRIVVWQRGPRRSSLTIARDWDAYLRAGRTSRDATIVDATHPLFVLHTSGTSGSPKGIVHVHGGFLAGASAEFEWMTGLTPGDVLYCTSDIGWMTGHMQTVYGALAGRLHSVIREGAPDHPAGDAAYATIARYRVTQIYTSPTFLRMLRRYGPQAADAHDLSSVRAVYSGGEALDAAVWRFVHEDVFHGRAAVCQHWGQTETGAPSIGFLPCEPVRPDRTGRAFSGLTFDVAGPDGRSLPPGTRGALVARTPWPHLFAGVWGDPERYAAYFETIPGCYLTGDVAVRDEDGFLHVIGRADDVLKVSGHRLAPSEIEAAALAHPACAEAAAIGIPHDLTGEAVKLFVVLRLGARGDDELAGELIARIRHDVGPIASPAAVEFVDALPKTRSGKIVRRVLHARETGEDPGDVTTLED